MSPRCWCRLRTSPQLRELRPPSGQNPPQGGGRSGSQTEVMKGAKGARSPRRAPPRPEGRGVPGRKRSRRFLQKFAAIVTLSEAREFFQAVVTTKTTTTTTTPLAQQQEFWKTTAAAASGRGKHKVRPWEDLRRAPAGRQPRPRTQPSSHRGFRVRGPPAPRGTP